MKSRKYIISSSNLNSLEYIETDLTYTDSRGFTYFPTAIRYSNLTDATIGFLCLSNETEKKEYLANDLYFDYLEIPAGDTVADLPSTQYLRISKLSGSAGNDLNIYVYNYISWKNE